MLPFDYQHEEFCALCCMFMLLYPEKCSINIYYYVSAYYAQDAGLYYGLSLSDNGFEVGL